MCHQLIVTRTNAVFFFHQFNTRTHAFVHHWIGERPAPDAHAHAARDAAARPVLPVVDRALAEVHHHQLLLHLHV